MLLCLFIQYGLTGSYLFLVGSKRRTSKMKAHVLVGNMKYKINDSLVIL